MISDGLYKFDEYVESHTIMSQVVTRVLVRPVEGQKFHIVSPKTHEIDAMLKKNTMYKAVSQNEYSYR